MEKSTETYTIKKTYHRGSEPFSVEYEEIELYDDEDLLFQQKVKYSCNNNPSEIGNTIQRLLYLSFNKDEQFKNELSDNTPIRGSKKYQKVQSAVRLLPTA